MAVCRVLQGFVGVLFDGGGMSVGTIVRQAPALGAACLFAAEPLELGSRFVDCWGVLLRSAVATWAAVPHAERAEERPARAAATANQRRTGRGRRDTELLIDVRDMAFSDLNGAVCH